MRSWLELSCKFLTIIWLPLMFSEVAFCRSETTWAQDPQWLKLYQYKMPYRSGRTADIRSKQFFLTENPKAKPQEEAVAALKIFKTKSKLACKFPAKKYLAQRLSGENFPYVSCPDLEEWLSRLNFDTLNIVFAGAYPDNPASILGHSFLRLSNKAVEQKTPSKKLLSYVIGYSALTDPRDGKIEYALKGMAGGYPGFYKLEPYYMSVGIYNNAESRDLWEEELKFNKEEVYFLKLYLWELIHNAAIDYYFAGENCSYRILTFLDVVRKDLFLQKDISWPVLPSESIRVLKEAGLVTKKNEYRPSIKKQLNYKLSQLSDNQLEQYHSYVSTRNKVPEISDLKILDALLDYWTYETYDSKGKLSKPQSQKKEAVFRKRASLRIDPVNYPNAKYFKTKLRLSPPYDELPVASIGVFSTNNYYGFKSFKGVHPLWQNARGFDSFAAIEYLGLDYRKHKTTNDQIIDFNFISVKTINPVSKYETPISWFLDIYSTHLLPEASTKDESFNFDAGLGLSFKSTLGSLYGFVGANLSLRNINLKESKINPLAVLGYLYNIDSNIIFAEYQAKKEQKQTSEKRILRFGKSLANSHVFVRYDDDWGVEYFYNF